MLPMAMLVASCHWHASMSTRVKPSRHGWESEQRRVSECATRRLWVCVCTLHWRFVRRGQLVTRSSMEFLCPGTRMVSSPPLTAAPVLLSGGHRIRHSWTHASFSGVPCPAARGVGALPARSFQVQVHHLITIHHPCSLTPFQWLAPQCASIANCLPASSCDGASRRRELAQSLRGKPGTIHLAWAF